MAQQQALYQELREPQARAALERYEGNIESEAATQANRSSAMLSEYVSQIHKATQSGQSKVALYRALSGELPMEAFTALIEPA